MKKIVRSLTVVAMAVLILLSAITVIANEALNESGASGGAQVAQSSLVLRSGANQSGWFQSYTPMGIRYGFRDRSGVEVIEPTYDSVWEFPDYYAAVGIDGKFGFVNPWGREVVPLVYDQVSDYQDGIAMIGISSESSSMKWGLVNVAEGAEIVSATYSKSDLELIRGLFNLPDGTVLPSKVEHLHWDEVTRILPMRKSVQVIDVMTGITYNVASLSNNIHADVETVTAQDTAAMMRSFSGRSTWFGRPIWVIIGDRTIAATIHSVAHDVATISGNNMDGHVCMHFRGSFTSNVGVHEHNQSMAALAYRAFELLSEAVVGQQWPSSTAESVDATLSDASLLINGEVVDITAYSIGGNNYFRLRDVADVLNGTPMQFNLEWDGPRNAILLTSNAPYTGDSDSVGSPSESATATPTTSSVLLDLREVDIRAYNIANNNFFMLRDIGMILGFDIEWNGDTRTISINTLDTI